MKNKNKVKLYSEYTKDEFIYEQIKEGMKSKSMSHIPYDSIAEIAKEVADEVEKQGFKFKNE